MLTLRRNGRGQAARELRKAANHGAVIMAWGRVWAVLLLIFFSAAALDTLAGAPIRRLATALQLHQPIDVTDAITASSTLGLVIGMDLAMVIATMLIRGMVARGKTFYDWWWLFGLAAFVAVIEALTFGMMIAESEHPTTGVAWLILVLRALAVPVCAVFLSLVTNLPVTPDDISKKIQIESGNGVLADVETKMAAGRADPSALWALFTFIGDEQARTQPDWADRVQEYIRQLDPDTIRAALEQRIATAEQRLAETMAAAKQQISDAQAAAKAQAIEMTSRAVTALIAGGNLPDWLTEARPELADITLTKRAVTSRKGSGIPTTKAPQSRPDAMRFFLHSLDITPAKAPDKMRGIWVKSSDIARMIGEHKLPESATELVKRLGSNERDGTAYIARLEDVMPALIAYHCVEDDVLNAWAMVPTTSGDSENNGAVIPFDSRRQA